MSETAQSTRHKRIRLIRITALMAAIFAFFQFLPDLAPERPSTLLREMTGDGRQDLCDVGSLGFLQVNQMRSPVMMRVQATGDLEPGTEQRVIAAFSTPGGTPLTEEDFEKVHTERIHLLIVDPSLDDYHHIHPRPGEVSGEYEFSFEPRKGGEYMVFADLMPKATLRPIQAVDSLDVGGEIQGPVETPALESSIDGYDFALAIPEDGLRARTPAVMTLQARSRTEGGTVKLEPVMDAFAHLVVFDTGRTGFAHLHPVEDGLDATLDETEPELRFVFHVDEPGYYRIWAQAKIDGEEVFVPFGVEVGER